MISRLAVDGNYATLTEVLEERAKELPDQLAFDFNRQEQVTFGALASEAAALARGLAARGLSRGDACAIILPTSLDQIRLVFAVQLAGGAPVLLDPDYPPALIARRAQQAGAKTVIVDAKIYAAVDEACAAAGLAGSCITPQEIEKRDEGAGPVLPEIGPEDTAYLQFTSGTMGEPKVAVILHRNVTNYLRVHRKHIGYVDDDVFLSWAPLYHDMGLVGFVFLSLYVGGPSYLLPPEMASLRIWLKTASDIKATLTSGPDFGYRYLTRTVNPEGLDLSPLRMTGSGGEPVRIETVRRFEERFGFRNTSVGGYGQAESVMCISMGIPGKPHRVDDAGNFANGPVLPELEVRILDEEGKALGPGRVGDIVMRGPSVFPGYLNDEEATREVLRDGWLHTGDTGYLDSDNYLFILGRKKALIKRGGSFISPREVEMAVDRVPSVRYAAAIGVPVQSTLSSEDLVVVAEVDPESGDSPEKRHAIAESIAAEIHNAIGHAPADVVLLKPRSIPRTANGKIQYGKLQKLYARNQFAERGLTL